MAPPPPPPPSTLPQLQTTSDFRPNELLKDMGFDIFPTDSSSNSTVSPTTVTIVDEKQYDLNSCLFHPCKLELFQALSNMEWYAKCPFSRECGVFVHRTMQNAYMGVLNRRVHDTYRKLNGTVMCECNCQASLKVNQSPLNPRRRFFTCRNNDGCRACMNGTMVIKIDYHEVDPGSIPNGKNSFFLFFLFRIFKLFFFFLFLSTVKGVIILFH